MPSWKKYRTCLSRKKQPTSVLREKIRQKITYFCSLSQRKRKRILWPITSLKLRRKLDLKRHQSSWKTNNTKSSIIFFQIWRKHQNHNIKASSVKIPTQNSLMNQKKESKFLWINSGNSSLIFWQKRRKNQNSQKILNMYLSGEMNTILHIGVFQFTFSNK